MKLFEILENDLDRAIDKIKADCQPFLTQSKGLPMLRGVAPAQGIEKIDFFSEQSIRMDRRPRNSGNDLFFNWAFDTFIQEQFDIKKVRSTSLFCTGGEGTAMYYGHPTFIFPKGNFKFIWSSSVNDSYEDFSLNRYFNALWQGSDKMHYMEWKITVVNPFIKTLIDAGDYDFDSLLKSDDPTLQEIHKHHKDDLEQLFKYKNTGLSQALKSRHEILIVGPNDYYILNAEKLMTKMDLRSKDLKEVYKHFWSLLKS
jgi:hypothetical protein